MNIHLLHIFILAPIFFYISLFKIPNYIFKYILLLGIVTFLYHLYINIIYKKFKLFHILVVAPILLYIGYYKPKYNDEIYKFTLMLAFAMIGYHSYKLLHNIFYINN